MRSRPSSMDISAGDLSLPSEFGQFGMTGNTLHVPFIQAAPAPKTKVGSQASYPDAPFRDDCTVRTARSSSTTLLRAVRRALDDGDDEHEHEHEAQATPPATAAPPPATTTTTRRSTWSSIDRLRGRVSGIFQRKHAHAPAHAPAAPPPSPDTSATASDDDDDIVHVAPRARRTFSFALRAARAAKIPAAHTPVGHVPCARRQRVRRSRSFSGFTSMAHRVLAPIADAAELDERTVEACGGVGRFWVYAQDEEAEAEEGGGGCGDFGTRC
ncbi:hypothetical protein MVEN_01318500 [Mycena venus]|uniref:Uncharacterized protein n=1 Tax=Mycena venus TaxID=2733690 RepID=A0A8H6XXM7_9AGAR|nr:hypothetical protein MVEN_01318500 [Mycena venus]